MKHGSLFSGIGGAELAASWMGWENVFHCEINKYNQKLLKQHFPQSIAYEDIKKTDFTVHRGGIDVLTGGFPCQPFSTAGKRKGTEDDRHLWPEMLRAIREISPRWIVGENVRGLTNWNGGLVFDQVQADMEAEGYEIIPFLFPACAVNAPHRRDRIWFIANATNARSQGFGKYAIQQFNSISKERVIADTMRSRQQGSRWAVNTSNTTQTKNWKEYRAFNVSGWQTEPGVRGRNDGVSSWVDRIKGLGNAWVPQATLQIFKAIEQYENLNPSEVK